MVKLPSITKTCSSRRCGWGGNHRARLAAQQINGTTGLWILVQDLLPDLILALDPLAFVRTQGRRSLFAWAVCRSASRSSLSRFFGGSAGGASAARAASAASSSPNSSAEIRPGARKLATHGPFAVPTAKAQPVQRVCVAAGHSSASFSATSPRRIQLFAVPTGTSRARGQFGMGVSLEITQQKRLTKLGSQIVQARGAMRWSRRQSRRHRHIVDWQVQAIRRSR